MFRNSLLTFFILIITTIGWAQESRRGGNGENKPGIISGNVVSKGDNKPVEYVSIALYSAKDSTLVTGIITDERGKFNLEQLAYGNYYLQLSFVGFETTTVPNISVSPEQTFVKLNDIGLDNSTQELQEIEVISTLPMLEYQIDKKVVNVDKQITSAGGTAVDVLQNVPSIQTDVTGNVSLRGSSGFMVFINGKPGVLQGSDALAQIPASSIDRIEIITNPSAKYDPDGTSGIINIITKKNVIDGFSGSVTGNAGIFNTYGGDILLTYRNKKINYIFGINYNNREFPGIESQNRVTTANDTDFVTYGLGESERNHRNWEVKGGAEIALSPRDQLNLSGNYGYRDGGNTTLLDYTEYTLPITTINQYTSYNESSRSGNRYSGSADYEHKFSKENQKLAAQVIYNYNNSEEYNNNELILPGGEVTSGIQSTENGPSTEFRVRLDYTHPLGQKNKLDVGAQSRSDVSNDTNKIYNLDPASNEYLFQPLYSNSVRYDRNIYAVYFMFGGEKGRWGYQAGLRGEYTDRLIQRLDVDSSTSLNRMDYFPSVHFSYKLPKDHQLMASYSRRIERPRSYFFEPFLTWVDAYNVRRGNPNILPEYIDSYELGYNKKIKKTMFSLEAYYRTVHNKIERYKTVYSENVVLSTFQNVGTDHSLGVEGMVSTDLFKWWNMDILGNLYYFKGNYTNGNLNNTSTIWNTRLNNTYYIGKNTQIQINSSYNSPSISAQGEVQGFFNMNAAVKQTFFEKKLSATLQLSDILRSSYRSSTSYGTNFVTEEYSRRNSPNVVLTLNYRFNNFKLRQRGGDGEGGSGEEF